MERERDLRFRRKEWSRERSSSSSSSRVRKEEGSHDVLIVEVLQTKP